MRTAGIAFILIALTCLWAYNTGRLEAILSVIQDPSYRPGKTEYVAGLGTVPRDAGEQFAGLGGSGGGSSGGSGDSTLDTIGGIFSEVLPFFL